MKTLTQDAMKLKLRPPLTVIPSTLETKRPVLSRPRKISFRILIRAMDTIMTKLMLDSGSLRQSVAPGQRQKESYEFVNPAAQYHRSTKNVF